MDTSNSAHPMGSPLLDNSASEQFSNSPRRHIDINNHEAKVADPLAAVLKSRQRSIDVFRGLTMLFMILVDNQGHFDVPFMLTPDGQLEYGGFVYQPFSEDGFWNGIRLCNFVFPFFLFIMGISTAMSNDKYVRPRKSEAAVGEEEGPVPMTRSFWYQVFKRFFLLFTIGLVLSIWGNNFHSEFRVMGVLQRIALCYFISTLLFVLIPVPWFQRVLVYGGFAGLYLGVMYGVDVPNCGKGKVDDFQCNAAGWVDREVFGMAYMYHNRSPDGSLNPTTDPEGLLSTLTAMITTWCGVECGRHLSNQKQIHKQIFEGADSDPWEKNRMLLGGWFGFGSALVIVGGVLSIWLPLNKQIWSLSFALLTGGSGAVCLALLYALIDVPWAVCRGCTHESGSTVSNALLKQNRNAESDSYGTVGRLSPPDLRRKGSFAGSGGGSGGCCRDVECTGSNVWNAILAPMMWLGMNPIAVFIGMVALEIILLDSIPKVACHGCEEWLAPYFIDPSRVTVWEWLYWKGTAGWTSDRKGASMFVAFIHVLIWELVAGIMYARRVFLKL